MAKEFYKGSVSSFALTVSIVFHLSIFLLFSAVHFSEGKSLVAERESPRGSISQVREVIESRPVMPKPKVSEFEFEDMGRDREVLFSSTADQQNGYVVGESDGGDGFETANRYAVKLGSGQSRDLEFFGSYSDERRVCFVVDCSGSMQGIFRYVQDRLKRSIGSLEADHYFGIIFFANGEIIKFHSNGLVRASQAAKDEAEEFIEATKPGGRTNAMDAIKESFLMRDVSGIGAGMIYFLTDGFELSEEASEQFAVGVANLRKQFAPGAKINTIGFWTQESDKFLLERIARDSSGEFVFVKSSTDHGDDFLE